MLGLLSRLLVLSVYDAGHLNLVALLTLKIMAIQGPAILSNPLVKKKKQPRRAASSACQSAPRRQMGLQIYASDDHEAITLIRQIASGVFRDPGWIEEYCGWLAV